MLRLLIQYFGPRANNALIIHEDGKDWVSSKCLCDLMGANCTKSEYHILDDQFGWTEMNLSSDDKRKYYDEAAHRKCPVWFVSKTGFWKIVARSNTLWARKFRVRFLPGLTIPTR